MVLDIVGHVTDVSVDQEGTLGVPSDRSGYLLVLLFLVVLLVPAPDLLLDWHHGHLQLDVVVVFLLGGQLLGLFELGQHLIYIIFE